MPSRFDEFWAAYPRKVGKLKAVPAYKRALKLATHDEIMTGVRCYLVSKPAYADWAHPTTWLSQGRWMDEPDVKPVNGARIFTSEELAVIAAHIRAPFYEHGAVPREVMEKCVAAGRLTREEMEAKL